MPRQRFANMTRINIRTAFAGVRPRYIAFAFFLAAASVPDICNAAPPAAGSQSPDELLRTYIAFATSVNEKDRIGACDLLVLEQVDPRHIYVLLQLLQDSAASVRRAAIWSVGELADRGAFDLNICRKIMSICQGDLDRLERDKDFGEIDDCLSIAADAYALHKMYFTAGLIDPAKFMDFESGKYALCLDVVASRWEECEEIPDIFSRMVKEIQTVGGIDALLATSQKLLEKGNLGCARRVVRSLYFQKAIKASPVVQGGFRNWLIENKKPIVELVRKDSAQSDLSEAGKEVTQYLQEWTRSIDETHGKR